MKKLFTALICATLLLSVGGCGSNDATSPKSEEQTKESDLDIISNIFTLEKDDKNGTVLGLAKDGDQTKFKIYITINDSEKELATAMGIDIGTLIYSKDGTDSETYIVDNDTVFVTTSNETAESMKNDMEAYLKEKNISLDQLRKALKEKFDIK